MTVSHPSSVSRVDAYSLFRSVSRDKLLVVALTLVGTSLGLIFWLLFPKYYAASAQLNVTGQISNPLVVDLKGGTLDSTQLVPSQIAVLQGQAIRNEVTLRLARRVPPLSATAENSSSIMLLQVEDRSPAAASSVLAEYIDSYSDLNREQDNARLTPVAAVLRRQIEGIDRQLTALASTSTAATGLTQQRSEAQSLLNQILVTQQLGSIIVQPVGPVVGSDDATFPVLTDTLAMGAIVGLLSGVATSILRLRRREDGRVDVGDNAHGGITETIGISRKELNGTPRPSPSPRPQHRDPRANRG